MKNRYDEVADILNWPKGREVSDLPYGLTHVHWATLRTRAQLAGWAARGQAQMPGTPAQYDIVVDAALVAVTELLLKWDEQEPTRRVRDAGPTRG